MSEAKRTISGKLAILAALGLGLAMAAAAWTYHYRQQRRLIELWGATAAQLVARGTSAEAWRLADGDEPAMADVLETITVEGRRLRVADRRDLTTARGLVHFRSGLLNANCFDWDAPRGPTPEWRYALRFSDGQATATFLFAPGETRLRLLEQGAEASVAPISPGLGAFLDEQFAASDTAQAGE